MTGAGQNRRDREAMRRGEASITVIGVIAVLGYLAVCGIVYFLK